MGADSKQREEWLKKLNDALRKKAREGADLSFFEKLQSYISAPKKWELLEKIAVPQGQVETQNIILCFDYLNDEECHYLDFDSAKGKSLVATLKQVSSCEVAAFPALRLVRDTVSNTGAYASLFRKLSPDVTQLQEIEMGSGRIFFFLVGNKFNIVSIETKHRNIDA